MDFVNECAPETEITVNKLYGPEPYNLNFVLPVPPVLATNRLRLVPFIPRVHASAYLDGVHGHESMFRYLPNAFEHHDPVAFLRSTEIRRRDQRRIIFAAIDTSRPDADHAEWEGSFVGLFGLWNTEKTKLSTEIGPAIVLPAFQRTHVATHAVSLLLKYVFELPPSGLGFRRVKWASFPNNASSNNLAERMGFKLEGVERWKYVLLGVEGYQRSGKEARKGDAGNGLPGEDSNEWGMCWDDWEGYGKELVERACANVTQ